MLFINADDAKGAEAACRALYAKQHFERATKEPATNAFGVWGLPFGEFVAKPRGKRLEPWGIRGGAAMLYPWQVDEIVILEARRRQCGPRENQRRDAGRTGDAHHHHAPGSITTRKRGFPSHIFA